MSLSWGWSVILWIACFTGASIAASLAWLCYWASRMTSELRKISDRLDRMPR